MKVHHINCGTMCPPASKWVIGHDELICHCLLIETDRDGLVLVETGIGTIDIHIEDRFPRAARTFLRPRFDLSETAIAHVQARGYAREDVRHIVLTHLHLDHAGGIADFPKAQIHVHAREHYGASELPTRHERAGYVSGQWSHSPLWQTYPTTGEDWFGFEAARPMRGLGDDFALIPLHGHTRGHSGVAVNTGQGWLLHAGDAYFHRSTIDGSRAPLGLATFERFDDYDTPARKANAARLAELHTGHRQDVRVFCAHDPSELAMFA